MRLKSSDDKPSFYKYTFLTKFSLQVMQNTQINTLFLYRKSWNPYFCVQKIMSTWHTPFALVNVIVSTLVLCCQPVGLYRLSIVSLYYDVTCIYEMYRPFYSWYSWCIWNKQIKKKKKRNLHTWSLGFFPPNFRISKNKEKWWRDRHFSQEKSTVKYLHKLCDWIVADKRVKRRKDGNFLQGRLPNMIASEDSLLFIQWISESGWQKVKKMKGKGRQT